MASRFEHSAVKDSKHDLEFNRLVATPLDETAVRSMPLIDAAYVLYDADDSAPTYIGINQDADAATSDTTWVVLKFLYSGSNVTSIRRKVGAWDNRATLF
jgi:hypothetical protein